MTNSYFNHTSPFARFTTADALRLNSTLKSIEAGFDKLPSASELTQGSRNYSVASNSGGAYSVTMPFTVLGYESGMEISFLASQANPIGATLNVNTLGPVTIKRYDGSNLLAADIKATSLNTVIHDGTNFRLVSMHGGSDALATTSATAASTSATQAAASAASALTSANQASISATTANTAATTTTALLSGSRFGIRNLLINPLFWMSQYLGTAASGTTTSGNFIRDRWKAGTSGVTWSVSNGVLTIASGSVIQIVQGRNIPEAGIYTLSWVGSATASVNGTSITNGGQRTLPAYMNVIIQFSSGTMSKPQLEYSPTKTQFEIRPADLDRLLCYQYYQKSYDDLVVPGAASFDGARHGTAQTTVNVDSNSVMFACPMRASPTVGLFNPQGYAGSMRNLDTNSDHAVTIQWINERGFTVFNSTAITVPHRFAYHWIASAEL